MEENKKNEANVPELGNPLGSYTTGGSTQTISPSTQESHVPNLVYSSSPITKNNTTNTTPFNGSTPVAPIHAFDPTVPPAPISTAEGSSGVFLQGQADASKSNGVGIIVGIFLLISVVVGASLYYYFFIYKVANSVAVQTPPPVTLIQEPVIEEEPSASSTEANNLDTPVVPIPVQSITPEELLAEIESASSSLANSDASILTFDDQVK
jgi:hypothetical protein